MLGKFSDLKVWFKHKGRNGKNNPPLPRNANADIFKNVKRSDGSGNSQSSSTQKMPKLGSVNTNTKIPTPQEPLKQTTTSARLSGTDMPPFLTTNKYNPPQESKDKGYSYPEVKDEYELSPPDEDHLYYSPGEPLTPRKKRILSNASVEQPQFSSPAPADSRIHLGGELSDNTVLSGDDAAQKSQDLKDYQREYDSKKEECETQTPLPIPEPDNSPALQGAAAEDSQPLVHDTADSGLGSQPQMMRNSSVSSETYASKDQDINSDQIKGTAESYEDTPGFSSEEVKTEDSIPATQSLELTGSLNETGSVRERVSEPVPELTKVDNPADGNSSYIAKISPTLTVYLYLRQIIAAFFTHTSLNIIFPRIALRLGPCYPSSMPVPYFVIGLLIGGSTFWFQNIPDGLLPAVIALTLFVGLTGTAGYRGFISMVSTFSKRQPDSCLQAACVCLYSMMFTAMYTVITMVYPIDLGFILVIGVVFMVSACAATSLNYGMRQNPIDFYGSLSLGGLLFCMLITAAVTYAVLNPFMATSVLGTALLVRSLAGQMLYLAHARASKNLVGGMLYLVLILVLADILIFSSRIDLLNPLFFG